MGQLLQMKFRPKTTRMICSKNISLIHSGKKWPWVEDDKEKGVMFCQTCCKNPSLADKLNPLLSVEEVADLKT